MLKSMEQMAREKIALYMRPLIIDGKKVCDGFRIEIAAKKAAAANPNFATQIYKIVAEQKKN
jgi:hypothetical protein